AEFGAGTALIAHPSGDLNGAFERLGNSELDIIFYGAAHANANEFFSDSSGLPFDLGSIDSEDLARFQIYTQVASLLGDRDHTIEERTAFAAIATIRDGT